MKTIKTVSQFLLTIICLLGFTTKMNGQFLKKLGKAAERAAERTVERRVEKETSEKTDQAMDSIFEQDAKYEKRIRNPIPSKEPTEDTKENGEVLESDSKDADVTDPPEEFTLPTVYKVSPDKSTTEGKNMSEPIGDTTTAARKSQNHRVEFTTL